MNKRVIILSLLMSGLLGVYFYFTVSADKHVEKIDIKSTKENVLNEIVQAREYSESTSKWMDSNEELNDSGYFNPVHAHNENEEEDTKREAINYFLTGILQNEVNIFMSAFHVQSISEDLFIKEEQDKEKVVEDIIKSISREGRIKDIHYENVKGLHNSNTNEANLTLVYEDNKKAIINLKFQELKDSHTEHEKGVQVITTSTWDMIEQIENSTK
ncbi:hypothetical protein AWM68_17680 [Fictibacillus phosphorivorans]|uniref:Uncharacterized protein n=1 Tax=Fictibacillus phosphorivorans TaxID=1221500 RepID=A0A163S2F3_9BACL|nr:hypothetical protein [Fictibacillus phosphorivorans]KZE68002.1 hypothetical protein AWM68_17680 [Fictibacillus phosphorivorans]